MNRTRREVLGIEQSIDLAAHIRIPPQMASGIYKCRVTYDALIRNVEFEKYQRKEVKTLKLVDGRDIDYRYKYADRSAIDALFALRGNCDDILIVKDGLITDTSYANVAMLDGARWYTPDVPLLEGTRRRQLLDEGRIGEMSIRVSDLHRFQKLVLFNAMRDFNVRNAIPVSRIVQ